MYNRQPASLLFVLLAWGLGATGFQLRPPSPVSIPSTGTAERTVLMMSSPGGEEDPYSDFNDFDGGKTPMAPGGIPKPKLPDLPKPKLPSFGDIDFKEIAVKFGALVATVLFFIAFQKLGLWLSDTFTPELSPEDIARYNNGG